MSKKKINAADIVDILAVELELTKKVSEDFIKALTDTIEEALLEKDSVKINGLGTFKIQWNKARKSVNVNTGEDIVIDGYYKAVFTPELSLRELANEPYEHLETIIIESEDDLEASRDKVVGTDDIEPTLSPLKHLDEQANEIKDLLSEINALRGGEDVEGVDVRAKASKDRENEKVKSVEEEVIGVKGVESVDSVEKEDVGTNDYSPEDENVEEDQTLPETEPMKSQNSISTTWKFIYTFLIIALIAVLIGVLVQKGAVSYLKEFFEDKFKTDQTELVQPQDADMLKESLIEEEILDKTQLVEPPSQVSENVEELHKLSEILTTEKVKPGSRLAQIAYRHYGAREFWVYIFEANRDKLNKPDDLSIGMELIIPKLDPSIGDKNNPECIEKALKLQDFYLKN